VALAENGHFALDLAVRKVSIGDSAVPRARPLCLHTSLDDVQRVHDQNLRHTGDGAIGELVDEGQRLGLVGHVDGCVGGVERWEGRGRSAEGLREKMRVYRECRELVRQNTVIAMARATRHSTLIG
jgi:hypothetical protein